MSALRWLSALLLVVAVAAGAMLLLQRQAAAELRGEIAMLRDEHGQLGRLRAENARLVAAQPSAAQLAAMSADHAAVARLRNEIEKLKAETDQQAREVERAASSLPASEWKNAGHATPAATIETLLWAASHRDVDTIASMLSFDPQLRPSVDRFFAVLPEATQTQYGTVERLIAEFMTRDLPLAGMQLVAEQPLAADRDLVTVRLQGQDGLTKEIPVPLQHGDDGWRLAVLPDAVQKIANDLGAQLAAAHKGG